MPSARESLDLSGVYFVGSRRLLGQAVLLYGCATQGCSRPSRARALLQTSWCSSPIQAAGRWQDSLNERALLEMVEAIHARVCTALRDHRFPVPYGGDCAVLLGAVPAPRDLDGTAGLLFVDAHPRRNHDGTV